MAAASEQMAPPADSIEGATPDAGLPVESAPVEIAAQPIPAEPTRACVAHHHRHRGPDRTRRARNEQRVRAGPDRRRGVQRGRAAATPARSTSPPRKKASGESHDLDVGHNVTEVNGHGAERRGRDRGIGRRRRRDGGSARAHAAAAPAVQDPGSHQAPPGDAGAGGQGGARHQGRGAHHLSLARRPLFGADAEHRARRRHQPQDHQRRRSQAPQGDRPGAGSAGRHGRDPAHRRREPHQDRGQARLRISAAAVGDGARPDAASRPRRRWSTRKARWSSARSATSTTRTSTRSLSPATTPTRKPKSSCACSCRAMPRT